MNVNLENFFLFILKKYLISFIKKQLELCDSREL